jgi:cytochrome c-type protein NapC
MLETHTLLAICALTAGVLAAALLIYYLVRRPALDRSTRVLLFFALGPLPIACAVLGNIANLEVSKKRQFCNSCHVMWPYVADATNPESQSLPAIHTRTEAFGHESCYTCHADYGMFGTVTTKIGGMRHVWDYYAHDWSSPDKKPKLYKPYSNKACLQCHPQGNHRMTLAHQVHGRLLDEGRVSCAAAGCHGPPHPTTGEPRKTAAGKGEIE